MKIFMDSNGNKFTWKVHCSSVPIENKLVNCIHCEGIGKERGYGIMDDIDCAFCYGTGTKKLQINCNDLKLEEYLQNKVDVYYNRKVEKAAIKADSGEIFSLEQPNRHHNVIKLMREFGYTGPVGGIRQGFILSDNEFVDRKEALEVAIRSKQLVLENCHAPTIGLFSEDLW